MTTLLQQLVDGLGRGSTYALLALGVSLVFGVMHLVNFAHGELLTVAAYTTYFLSRFDMGWWVAIPVMILASVGASMAIERVAFRRIRGASPFAMLLTSFAIELLSHALWRIGVSPKSRKFDTPSWAFDTVLISGVRLEVMDLVTIGVTLAVLAMTLFVVQRTMFGIAIRASAEDFDAARLMGVRANRVISGAFAFAGFLAGIAAVLVLMRRGQADPTMGSEPLLKAVVAAIVGGLGSLRGAVIGGLALGVLEVFTRAWLPGSLSGLTDAFVFAAIAVLFVVRPQGLLNVATAERV